MRWWGEALLFMQECLSKKAGWKEALRAHSLSSSEEERRRSSGGYETKDFPSPHSFVTGRGSRIADGMETHSPL